ncbi:helix-turn-helix transcriptional regulator [Paenibacillus gansuensis]|uniref:Helix-turn-helix transcriptional regulator n=1 Tax=Paenibacillus gansuensis TaxID=306542 RepID=A0ABW5PIQ8_9BACL
MSKAKRLMELMMTVNRKRRFKVQELADEFGVSKRTMLRDLQELGELGVPLYSEVGPHGGYQVVRERVLPPIAFTEEEAVSMFFAVHSLRHYSSLPFEAESASALNKFYLHMPGDVRDRIDSMKHRVDFITPTRHADAPFLAILLEAAVNGKVLEVIYTSKEEGEGPRRIQPAFLYAHNGFWYCKAYCFLRQGFRVFRCDRISHAEADKSGTEPMDLSSMFADEGSKEKLQGTIRIYAELTRTGVQRCEAERWLASPLLQVREDGTGVLEMNISGGDLPFFAEFFIGLGKEVALKDSEELQEAIRDKLSSLLEQYR